MLNQSRLERSKSRRKEYTESLSPRNTSLRTQLINQIVQKLDSVVPVDEVPSPPLSRRNSQAVVIEDKIRNLEGMLKEIG